jgi:hypothetical protein
MRMIYLTKKNLMKKMKRVFKFLAYFMFVCSIYGQSDTSEIKLIYSPGFTFRIDSLSRLNNLQSITTFLNDTSSIWIRTRMQLNGFMSEQDPQKNNFRPSILNPLRQIYLDSQNMSGLYYVLGMVQAGAFGYFAYEHLKKYGFLKKN